VVLLFKFSDDFFHLGCDLGVFGSDVVFFTEVGFEVVEGEFAVLSMRGVGTTFCP